MVDTRSDMVETGSGRREFLNGAVTGLGVGMLGAMGLFSWSPWRRRLFPEVERAQLDFGVCRNLRVTNISETSWFDNAALIGDIKRAGGLLVSQYDFNWPPFCDGTGLGNGSYERAMANLRQWLPDRLDRAWEYIQENAVHPENAGGFSCLLEVEALDGTPHRILFDTGWGYPWMEESFRREGIDRMLARREIDFLYITHEHFDHFWGLPVALKYDPTVRIVIPDSFYNEGLRYLRDSGHRGEVTKLGRGVTPLLPGVASYKFDIPIICRVFGEQDLYFNVRDRGLVSVTGCCHQGIVHFADSAFRELKIARSATSLTESHAEARSPWTCRHSSRDRCSMPPSGICRSCWGTCSCASSSCPTSAAHSAGGG